jgi:hypothetical protein
MRVHAFAAALLVACALGACGRSLGRLPWQRGGLSFEQFVSTTVELRQAAASATTPAAFQARKREIEARLKVTDADLERFTREHANEVKLLSAAWDSVEARLGRGGPRGAAGPTPLPPQVGPYPAGGRPPSGRQRPAY